MSDKVTSVGTSGQNFNMAIGGGAEREMDTSQSTTPRMTQRATEASPPNPTPKETLGWPLEQEAANR